MGCDLMPSVVYYLLQRVPASSALAVDRRRVLTGQSSVILSVFKRILTDTCFSRQDLINQPITCCLLCL
ncbi:hypothetical protein RRG08_052966 [Elysia crispata]|uniref:Uncharacterized protein n=1 Tax=Elysia crispata TaxID=231223 RepID=A0AAE1DHD0_9GAST|nr:hypothetical protein RRG08_052966 [Elysia crispata]